MDCISYSRISSINQKEMDKAFYQARHKGPALVGIASHDFRDLRSEVNFLRKLIKNSSKKFKDVKFRYSEAKESFVELVKCKENIKKLPQRLKLKIKFKNKTKNDFANITVQTEQGKVFGPQPFLAIQTKSKRFIHDNFDFSIKKGAWHYAFQPNTLPIEDVLKIGVAANDSLGNSSIKRLNLKNPKKIFYY